MKITHQQIVELAVEFKIETAMLKAFLATETPFTGFDSDTGKILIQFEPAWMRKRAPYAPSGKWSLNKVEVQAKEWLALNDAFAINPTAAMESTSIGMPQILGVNYKECGYKSVGEMWDDFKTGEYAQVRALCRFIKNKPRLYKAIVDKNFSLIAEIYNGPNFREMAVVWNREPYDVTMKNNFDQYERA